MSNELKNELARDVEILIDALRDDPQHFDEATEVIDRAAESAKALGFPHPPVELEHFIRPNGSIQFTALFAGPSGAQSAQMLRTHHQGVWTDEPFEDRWRDWFCRKLTRWIKELREKQPPSNGTADPVDVARTELPAIDKIDAAILQALDKAAMRLTIEVLAGEANSDKKTIGERLAPLADRGYIIRVLPRGGVEITAAGKSALAAIPPRLLPK